MNRRFVRSRTDRVIGGVAAGLADYMNADTALVRIAWALLIPLTGGAALLAYIVAWIVVPEGTDAPVAGTSTQGVDGTDPALGDAGSVSTSPATLTTEPRAGRDNRAGLVVGIGLVLVGLWFLLREYLPDFDWSLVWPIVLIGVGVLILVGVSRRRPGA
jgi:phage shock protein PspC (stress-responsive transcriptional regulator)